MKKIANINNRKSIEEIYSEIDHNNYMEKQGGGELTACIEIVDAADKDGDFRLTHGWYAEKNEFSRSLRLPIQGRYDLMLDWIEQAAKDGEI